MDIINLQSPSPVNSFTPSGIVMAIAGLALLSWQLVTVRGPVNYVHTTMTGDDLCYLTAGRALALFGARQLSPVELLQGLLARADRVIPRSTHSPIATPTKPSGRRGTPRHAGTAERPARWRESRS
jgi:hypothetical protein